jgi:hypothetical protein
MAHIVARGALISAFFILSAQVQAQIDQGPVLNVTGATGAFGGSAVAPDNDLRTGFGGSGILIETASDKTDVSLSLARRTARLEKSGDRVNLKAFTLKFTTPVDKGGGDASFVTDAGLASAFSAELGFSLIQSAYEPLPDVTLVMDALERSGQRCDAAAKADGVKYDCTRASDTLQRWMNSDELKLFIPSRGHWTTNLNVTTSIGRKEFRWRDDATLEEGPSAKHTPFSFSFAFGVRRVAPGEALNGWYLGLGAEYKREYKEADKRILCLPAQAGKPQECKQDPFSAPKRNIDTKILSVFRKSFYIEPLKLPFGVQVKLAHDFEDEISGLESSIYGFADKDSKLTGGVRVKLQTADNDPDTKDDKATVSLFIGKAF